MDGLPVDISEAWKQQEKRELFSERNDDNRLSSPWGEI
jgi:hypothetical protein